jgi:hypothetical protein
MSTARLYILAGAAGTIVLALLALTVLDQIGAPLPPWLDAAAKAAPAVAAMIGAAVAYVIGRSSRDPGNESSTSEDMGRPEADSVTAANEADDATDAVTDDEQNPSASDVADDINDLTSELN